MKNSVIRWEPLKRKKKAKGKVPCLSLFLGITGKSVQRFGDQGAIGKTHGEANNPVCWRCDEGTYKEEGVSTNRDTTVWHT